MQTKAADFRDFGIRTEHEILRLGFPTKYHEEVRKSLSNASADVEK